ncbi:hypothetical protein L6452_02515 [Arctium lappa]|uniref:Uncharacterized protein n=1 Tax=Arctium lappa TaxID=4217 RepID=A0ACB9FJT6_ARCLA|nr:hypothetical protein L6452_02515 [Arctium lappa]
MEGKLMDLWKENAKPNMGNEEKNFGMERKIPATGEMSDEKSDEGEEGSMGVQDTIMTSSSKDQNGDSKKVINGGEEFKEKEKKLTAKDGDDVYTMSFEDGPDNSFKDRPDISLKGGPNNPLNDGPIKEIIANVGACIKRSKKEKREAQEKDKFGETQIIYSTDNGHEEDAVHGNVRKQNSKHVFSQNGVGMKSIKRRRGECVFGRGRVSFHYIKQKARKKKSQNSGEATMGGRSKQTRRGSQKTQSISLSGDVRSGNAMEGLVEFGKEIGVNWVNGAGATSK